MKKWSGLLDPRFEEDRNLPRGSIPPDASPRARIDAYHDAMELVRAASRRSPDAARGQARDGVQRAAEGVAAVEARLILATVFDELGDLVAAGQNLADAHARAARLCDDPLLLMVLVARGRLLVMQGDEAKASQVLLAGVELASRLGARRQEAKMLGNLGFLHGESDGRPYEAYTRRALEIGREIDDSRLIAHSLCNLGGALAQQERYEEARACYEEGLPLAESLGWLQSVALFWAGLGGVCARTAELTRGVELYARSTEYFRSVGDHFQVARQYMIVGRHFAAAERHAEARSYLVQSLAMCDGETHRNTAWQAHGLLSEVLEALGDDRGALASLRASIAVRESLFESRIAERQRLLELHVEAERTSLEAEWQRQRSAELDRLASTDPLTGLFNRRHLGAVGMDTFARAHLSGTSLTLALIDIDHFKGINDQHGHEVGDQVLVALGGRLGRSLRATDVLARWGGEEFCVVLPEISEDDAMAAVGRLFEAVRATPLETRAGPQCITISLGLTRLLPADVGLDDLLRRADRALYQAKRAGRDRIVRDDDP